MCKTQACRSLDIQYSSSRLAGRRDNQIEVEFPSWLQELLLLTYFDKVSFKFELRSDFEKSWIKFQHYYGRSKGMTIGDQPE